MVFKLVVNRTLKVIVLTCLILSFTNCNQKKESKTKKETPIKVSLRQAWFTWAGYAGEVEAIKIAPKYGIELKIDKGADDIDPVKMVLSGENDFGITSAETLLLANQKGANLVAVGVINYKSPTCYVSLKNKNIKSLKDFENKRIGILTGSETETIYRILAKRNQLDLKKIREIEASFDLGSFLTTDSYDIRPAFVFDELVTLDQKKIQYNVIKPEDYGVELMGAVYFTTSKMINENPKAVQSFINSIADGWKQTIKNPKRSIELLSQFDNKIDKDREYRSLIKGLDYFKGQDNKVLFADNNRWKNIAQALYDLKKTKKLVDPKLSYNNSFILNYYNAHQ